MARTKAEPAAEPAAEPQSLYAQIVEAAATTRLAGDHAAHGALLAIETSMIELKNKIAMVEGALPEDARAIVDQLKAAL
ncbi:hypothetical protein G3N95_30040 [Paraburkholderia sp. Tr-20389]|uniref:hypothetical protein n=1 Tax=Paraburkholderia sp. Tr-20389 TaxID=2703903 RepID=UPI00197FA49A|nr:hypothetical protein [Paraburkholderia sp. Tr-20389]MBN3757216.1 hypothetical protein [Paraburkholderia sp. Tr-20389]